MRIKNENKNAKSFNSDTNELNNEKKSVISKKKNSIKIEILNCHRGKAPLAFSFFVSSSSLLHLLRLSSLSLPIHSPLASSFFVSSFSHDFQ